MVLFARPAISLVYRSGWGTGYGTCCRMGL